MCEDSAALVFCNGTALEVLYANSTFWAIGNTDPETSGKSNVYLKAGATLAVRNRTASNRRYSIVPVVVHAVT